MCVCARARACMCVYVYVCACMCACVLPFHLLKKLNFFHEPGYESNATEGQSNAVLPVSCDQ
jgi:hypothetical protein